MQILILRHGIAEDVPKGGGGDEKRALTSEGRKKMEEIARGFARLEIGVERIFSSPLVRAWQTAEILAEAAGGKVEEMVELAPGHRPQEVLKQLQRIRDVQSVVLAGHEPNCSELAAYLLSGNGTVELQFKKGGMCLIENERLNAGEGILIWHLTPHILRALGKED